MMAELPALRAAVAALEDGIAQSPDRDAEEVASRFSAALRALADLTISQRSVLGADLSAMTDEVESTAKQVAQQREGTRGAEPPSSPRRPPSPRSSRPRPGSICLPLPCILKPIAS